MTRFGCKRLVASANTARDRHKLLIESLIAADSIGKPYNAADLIGLTHTTNMKKTLITLAALAMASVASAATTLEDATLTLTDPTPHANATSVGTFSDSAGDFTMTFVIDWNSALDSLGIWNDKSSISLGGNSADSFWWDNGVQLFKSDHTGVDSLYVSMTIGGNQVAVTSPDVQTGSLDKKIAIDSNNGTLDAATYKVDGKLALTYTYESATDTFTLYALTKNGGLGVLTHVHNYDIWGTALSCMKLDTPDSVVEQIYAFNTVLSHDDIVAVSQDAIPEPATATLSLLALAGLAARRRRK